MRAMPDNAAKGNIIGQRVLRNTISNFIGKFITLASFFFLTPFVLHHLGSTQYGLWVLVGSALAYGALLDFGIMNAIIKYVAEFKAQERPEDTRKLLSSALWLYSVLGAAAVILSAAFAPLFPRIFNVPPDERSTAAWLMFLMGVGVGVQLPCLSTTAVLRGLQRYDIVSLLSAVAAFLYVGAVVLALSFGGGLLHMAAISMAVTVVMQFPAIWFVKRNAPELHVSWGSGERQWARRLASFSSWLFLLDLSTLIRTKTDVMVIGSFLPLRTVTPYGLARKMGESGQVMTDQFMKVVLPLASELHAGNDSVRLRSLYLTGTRLALGIFMPIAFVLIALARSILTVWVGAEYANSAPLVGVLALAYLGDVLAWPAGTLLQGIGKPSLLAKVSFCGALLNIPLTIFLTSKYHLMGAACAALFSTTAVAIGFVLPHTMRVLGISGRQILKETILPALLPAVPMAVALYILKLLMPSDSILTIVAIAAASALVYVIGYLALGASELERRTCWNFAMNAMRFAEARLKRS